MEDSSHDLIDQMIAEEQHCYGFENSEGKDKTDKSNPVPVQESTGQTQVPLRSSKSLEPHNKRWSEEEDALLAEYVKSIGYGKWKEIAEKVKTRNALQCKNRASQRADLQKYAKKSQTHQNDDEFTENPVENHKDQDHSDVPSNDIPSPDKPQEEVKLDLDSITEDERKCNTEWFMGKPAKTPERYMRIRNHIIQCWYNSKPTYLTKTAGRKNLKDCGDVNAVGRIHSYLEMREIINVNCSMNTTRSWKRSFDEHGSASRKEKKKAKQAPGYYWADVDSEDEETSVPHSKKNIIQGDGKSRPKRSTNKRNTFYDENRIDYGMSDDPFRLIPVGYYPKQSFAPFSVQVTSDALLVMEFHSHLAYTEIIGLLGGSIIETEDGKKKLLVEYVFPCRSTSTGIQCEMDPVSEMDARELFEKKGLQVVGWYHSHPTFDPEPSIRDIENQSSYQDLFRDESSGIEPFIGIIITPYPRGDSDRSQFQFIHISNKWSSNNQYRLPFACVQEVKQCQTVSPEVLEIFKNILIQYKYYEHKIDMKLTYGSMTRLEKLLRSLKSHIFMGVEENGKFLMQISNMVQQIYMGQSLEVDEKQDSILKQENNQSNLDKVVDSLAI